MKHFVSAVLMVCLICFGMAGLAENADQPVLIPAADGYQVTWEGFSDTKLLLKPVDQEGNPVYVDHMDIESFITYTDNGCRIKAAYTIYPERKFYRIPVVMTEERYQELKERMSPKDKKRLSIYKLFSHEQIAKTPDADELFAAFPALETEDLYILISAVPGHGDVQYQSMSAMEAKLAEYGYTDEDFEKDLANVAVRPVWIEMPHANKCITCQFENPDCELLAQPGERELQMAALANAIHSRVVSLYLRSEGEKEPVADVVAGIYQLEDLSWSITLDSMEEYTDQLLLIIDVVPEL